MNLSIRQLTLTFFGYFYNPVLELVYRLLSPADILGEMQVLGVRIPPGLLSVISNMITLFKQV